MEFSIPGKQEWKVHVLHFLKKIYLNQGTIQGQTELDILCPKHRLNQALHNASHCLSFLMVGEEVLSQTSVFINVVIFLAVIGKLNRSDLQFQFLLLFFINEVVQE